MGWWTFSRGRIAAWRRLSARDKVLVGWSWVMLLAADLLLRVLGFQRTRAIVASVGSLVWVDVREDELEAVVGAVQKAARNHLWEMKCLSRSLVVCWLAADVGDVELRIGVKRERASFEAHAWVELRGRAIGETGSLLDGYLTLEGI